MAHPKIALVTGAGSGIGRATALLLLKSQYRVALVGRTTEKLEETAQMSEAPDEHALILPTDVTHPSSVAKSFSTLQKRWGRLDLLFNNAGHEGIQAAIEEIHLDDWHAVLNVNVTGAFLCTQQAFQLMKHQAPRGGRIINGGSVAAHTPRPMSCAYTVSKHALTGLTRATALDGRPFDIACSQIDIGNVETEMTARMGLAGGALQANGDRIIEPLIDAQHVADAVLHIASLPIHANIQFMTLMATQMPYIGRG